MLFIKYINIGLVFVVTFLIGYFISKKYSNRVEELKDLQTALNILETKIKFTYEPLSEIFMQISEMLKGKVGNVFINMSHEIKNSSANQTINKSFEIVETDLKTEDIKIIENLGKILGKTDKEGQVSQIELTSTFLKSQISKAEKEEEKNAKLYKTLGATIGLAFVIILI